MPRSNRLHVSNIFSRLNRFHWTLLLDTSLNVDERHRMAPNDILLTVLAASEKYRYAPLG